MTARTPDRALVQRASRVIAAQTAAAVAAVLVLVGLTVYLVQVYQLHDATEDTVRSAARSADEISDAPPGVILIHRTGSEVQIGPGAPAAFEGLRSVRLPAGLIERQVGDQRYEVFTDVRGEDSWSAALNLRRRNEETDRLLGALILAGLVGIAGAAGVGAVVGRRAMRPAAEALALQRRFVADASHELRTPLTIVHTRAQLLRARFQDSEPETRSQLDQLVADTRSLGDVVEDLLMSAQLAHRPEAGELVDLAAVVAEVVDSFEILAAERSVALDTGLDTDHTIDSGAVPSTVRGSRRALRRALAALVDNALGHVASGGRVRVDVTGGAGQVTVRVRDDGEGFDPATAGELLGRFARGSAAPDRRRYGLGLALVHEVVTAHGGTLTLDGSPGAGATVTLTLPAA
jgi:signal transduction histidine kinase